MDCKFVKNSSRIRAENGHFLSFYSSFGHSECFSPQIEYMKGNWTFGAFCLQEAETLYNGVTNHLENAGCLEE